MKIMKMKGKKNNMAINKVILTGRLTKDAELRATATGTEVTSFTVAVDGFSKEANNTSFINCVAWNHAAKFITTYCKKGSLVAVEGRLQTRTYDKRDGSKATVTEVVVERVENYSPKENVQDEQENVTAAPVVENDNPFSDDDLPF